VAEARLTTHEPLEQEQQEDRKQENYGRLVHYYNRLSEFD
jgi:hypothetical protein